MKVINNLICCSVPRGAEKFRIVGGTVAYDKDKTSYYEALHFPAEIIGLASEIEYEQVSEILRLSHALVWEIKGAKEFMFKWLHKRYDVPLPTPATDIIFLIKTK